MRQIMKVAVVGVGGVGGYFGGKLAQAGHDVIFIARGATLEALRTRGLCVDSVNGDFVLERVNATDDPKDIVDAVLFAVKAWQIPDAAVARAGVKPEEVTDVILTHAHWDHADGADLFPKATVWIQKDEYAYYTGAAWQEGGKHGGIDPEDLAALLQINTQGRLRLVDGDREILPGVRVYVGGRHTFASQYVSVPTRSGPAILASDNMYLYENLEKHAPIAQTFDRESNLKAQDNMKALAGAKGHIVPGHDPAVMTRYPKVAEGVVRID